MSVSNFSEGVRPGGLTTTTEVRILLCYILDSLNVLITRQQLEDVLLGEELVNYFTMAESLTQLVAQGLMTEDDGVFRITEQGRTVAQTLAQDVPRTVRDTAVRGVIRAQQYAAKQAAHHSQVVKTAQGNVVQASIGDGAGPLFKLELYMPDDLTAKAVQRKFVEHGDTVYKLVLAALTENRELAQGALAALDTLTDDEKAEK